MILGTAAGDDPTASTLCEQAGAIVVSVEDRLVPVHPHPAPVEDCAGLVWMAAKPSELALDPERLALYVRVRAGGGLVIATAMLARDRSGPR